MTSPVADPGVVERIERTCSRATTGEELFAALSHEVDKLVPFDGSMWFGVDPSTVLAVSPARFEGLHEGYCQTFWDGEFHEPDVALYRDLARDTVPAAGLREATADRPLRSARYRRFVKPQGYDDELRVAFRSGENTWAVAALYRETGRRPFSDEEVALMAALSAVVGAAFRTQVATGGVAPALCTSPGLLMFDASSTLISANVEADRWLDDIYGLASDGAETWREILPAGPSDDLRSAIPILPLLARARAVAAGVDEGPARLRLRDRKGRWLVLHASCLSGGPGDGTVAVVVEPAKSSDIAPIVIEAYGLSPRERDVVRAIARGLSTPDIASQLFLSAHTVRYYIKTVFEKVGVSTRGELVAKLFAEHYSDPMHATAVHVH